MSLAEPSYQLGSHAEQDASASLGDYFAGLNRQRKPIIFAAGVILLLALLAALFLPPTYSSTATILIEEQEIPEDMVRSTITSFATEQIEIIRQRALTQQNIMGIVEKYSIYDKGELARITRAEIANEFIEAVNLELLNTEVIDPRSGRPTEATIAFKLEFKADSPQKALNVTNELVNLFLNENLRIRSAKASSTSDFLRKEADDLSREVETLEKEISRFKAEHQSALPENFQINLQNVTRYQSQLLAAQSQLQQIEERIPQIEAQLATTSSYAPTVLASGESVLGDVDRLKALQSDYRRKAARYSSNHPDLIALNREIDLLASQVGHSGDKNDLLKLVASRKNELLSLKSKYADDHPEVLAQEHLIDQLERQVSKLGDSEPDVAPDNPAYIMMDNQLKALQMEKAALQGQVTQLGAQIEALNQAALQAPTVEREYNNLIRNRDVATAKYLDLRVKLKEAELASELEEGRMAQRFTLIDPPTLPEKPVSPNRIAIMFLGAVLAAGAGLGMALLLEAMDQSIRSTRKVSELMGLAPLVTIPYIETPAETLANRPQRKLYFFLGGAILLGVIFFSLVHFYYKPLDVLWFVVLRKLGIG